MTALLLLAPSAEGGQVEQIARTFGVNWAQFFAQVISFAIVCALLYRFAYRPILAMLAERREQIALGWPTPRRSRPSWQGRRPSAVR